MSRFPKYIGLDFETYSDVDLTVHGMDRYMDGEFFRPLIAATAQNTNGRMERGEYDFVHDHGAIARLEHNLQGNYIVAHNADFERSVLEKLGIDIPRHMFLDSAVISRATGAASRLASAAPQLLGVNKMEEGVNLLKLFAIPGKYQEAAGGLEFDPQVTADNKAEWIQFMDYCFLDAKLSLMLWSKMNPLVPEIESDYEVITSKMNATGWRVDLDTVEKMQELYFRNVEMELRNFRNLYDSEAERSSYDPVIDKVVIKPELNFNSSIQLKAWCAERGVKATSFDEKHTATLLARLDKKVTDESVPFYKMQNYLQVQAMLRTKQVLGGSSLKKLQTIKDTVGIDGILRGQYLHAGAGQTLRTSGRSVQMQNLKRLDEDVADMSTLYTAEDSWTNEKLAANLRQVFTSRDPNGQLIVGDFSSVESRGLAYLAGAEWKREAYLYGKDMYKVLAAKIYSKDYDAISKPERQTGKVGELSCGYGAGGGAVHAFAQNMGVDMSEVEAIALVKDWRDANPEVVDLWATLDELLRSVTGSENVASCLLGHDLELALRRIETPASLRNQVGASAKLSSIQVCLYLGGQSLMTRTFHGCHQRGRNIGYFKPSSRKTGDLWSNNFTDPKTKQLKFYSIYGGKLAGILTQSFCREIFFQVLKKVDVYVDRVPNIQLVGQFHDEIVLDWAPGLLSLEAARKDLETLMSAPPVGLRDFPLAADIKSDYRYTK